MVVKQTATSESLLEYSCCAAGALRLGSPASWGWQLPMLPPSPAA